MNSIQWIIVIPMLVVGATGLWLAAKHGPIGILLLIGIALHIAGHVLSNEFPSVENGYTGIRYGNFIQTIMPDIAGTFQLLGFIGIVHGVIQSLRNRGKGKSQQKSGR